MARALQVARAVGLTIGHSLVACYQAPEVANESVQWKAVAVLAQRQPHVSASSERFVWVGSRAAVLACADLQYYMRRATIELGLREIAVVSDDTSTAFRRRLISLGIPVSSIRVTGYALPDRAVALVDTEGVTGVRVYRAPVASAPREKSRNTSVAQVEPH